MTLGCVLRETALFVAWLWMAVNGISSLVGALLFSGHLEKMKTKITSYNPKIFCFISDAAMTAIYGYLSSAELKRGGVGLAA